MLLSLQQESSSEQEAESTEDRIPSGSRESHQRHHVVTNRKNTGATPQPLQASLRLYLDSPLTTAGSFTARLPSPSHFPPRVNLISFSSHESLPSNSASLTHY